MLLGNVCVVRPVGGQPFALIGTDQGNETYIVDDDNDVGEMLVGAPCGCMACDEHAQAGYEHAKCPTPALLSTLGGTMAPGDNRVLISLLGYRNAQIEVRRRPGLPGIDLKQAIMRAREYRF